MEIVAQRILNTWEVRKTQRETFSLQQIQRQQLQFELLRQQIDKSLNNTNMDNNNINGNNNMDSMIDSTSYSIKPSNLKRKTSKFQKILNKFNNLNNSNSNNNNSSSSLISNNNNSSNTTTPNTPKTPKTPKTPRQSITPHHHQHSSINSNISYDQHYLDNNNNNIISTSSSLHSSISSTNNTTTDSYHNSINNSTTTITNSNNNINENPLLETSTEIARQLTMIDMEIYMRIQPKECLNQSWSKENQKKQAPNIFSMIERTNNLVTFVSFNILKPETPKERSKIIHIFIKIANELKNLNNYNSLKGIITGLNSNSIFRLKKTWSLVSDNKKEQFKELVKLVSHDTNYKKLREALKLVEPPAIPYIGMYLSDLTFIEEGNIDTKDGKINFYKQRQLANVIRNIQKLQKTPYNFTFHPVRNRLNNLYFNNNFDDQQLYDLSLEREPRI